MNENLGQQQLQEVKSLENDDRVLVTSPSHSEDNVTILRESSCQTSTENQTEGVNQCCNNLFSPKLTQIIENNENEESPSKHSFKQQSSEFNDGANKSIPFSTHSDINDDLEHENLQRSSRRRENHNQLPFQIANNSNSSQVLQQQSIQGKTQYSQMNQTVQVNKQSRYNSSQQYTTNQIQTSKIFKSQQLLDNNQTTPQTRNKNQKSQSKILKTQRNESNQGMISQKSIATAGSSKNSLSPRRSRKKGYFSLLFKSGKKSQLRSDSQPKTIEFTENNQRESNQNFQSDFHLQSQQFEDKHSDKGFKKGTYQFTQQQMKQESPTLKKQKISTRNIMVVNGRESNPFVMYKSSNNVMPRFSNVSMQKPQNSLSVTNFKSQNHFDFSKLQEIKEEDNQSQIDQKSLQNSSQNQKNFSISSKSNQKYPQKSDSKSRSQKKKQQLKINDIKNKLNSTASFQDKLRKNSMILATGQDIIKQENLKKQENNITLVLSPTRCSNMTKKNYKKVFNHQMIKNSQPVCLKQSIKKIKKELNEVCCYDLDHGVDQLRHHHHKIEQEDNLLTDHWRKYNAYKNKQKEIDQSQLWDWKSLVEQIREQPIKCVKYNHALDPGIQNYLQYESIINVSEDGSELIIINKKPKVNDQLVLESDPILLKQKQQEYQHSVRQKKKIIKKKINELKHQGDMEHNEKLKDVVKMYKQTIPDGVCSISSCDSVDSISNSDKNENKFGNNLIESEIDRIQNNFKLVKSTASCNISEIENIIFGGQSSRFWLYRKHMLCLDYQILKNDTMKKPKNRRTKMPFYAWQCITLQLKGRMIDLVIKNEKSMNLFLRYLIMATNTLDGNRDSAQGLINYLFTRSCKKRAKVIIKERGECLNLDNFLAIVPANEKQIIKKMHSAEVYRQTFFKYMLMKIRIKIGFHAYQKRNTISELIIRQILDSYTTLTESKSINPVAQYSEQSLKFFDEIIKGDISQCVLKLMKLNTDPIVIKRKQVLYRQKELRQLGYTCIDHMPDNEYKQALQLLFEQQIQTIFQNQLQLKFKAHNILQKQKTMEADHDHLDESNACNNHTKHNVNKFSKGFGLFEYSRCHDLFQNVKVNGKNMYVPRDAATQLRHKFNRRVLNEEFIKLKFILGVGALNDVFFIKTILSKIQIAKQQFVLELEEGQEVYIPQDLSCDAYPHSFRYYDPIIQISNQLMSKQSKTYFSFKTEFNLNKIKTSDWQREWLTNLGIFEAPNQRKQVHKHQVVNVEEGQWELQYTESHHPMDLQNSRYILIDTSEESLKRQALLQLEQEANFEKYSKTPRRYDLEKSIEDRAINFRFCHNQEVNNNQLLNISFKQAFYQSTDMLKNQGQKLHTLQRIQKFIDENLDEIFENRPRSKKEMLYIQKNWNPKGNPEFHNLIDIECIPDHTRTARQKAIVYHEKRIYYKKLLEDYERHIQNKKVRKRVKMLAETARDCDKKLDYNTKNAFLEERIEFTNKYFSYMNDFKHRNAQMQKIRKDLFIINRQLKLRNKLLKKNTDPFDILKAIVIRVKTNKEDGDMNCLKRSTRMVMDYDKKFMQLKKKENLELMSKMNKKSTHKRKSNPGFSAAKANTCKQNQSCEKRISVIG